MHTIELTDDELRLVRAALRSYLEDFGHEEADILRAIKEVLAKLPSPESVAILETRVERGQHEFAARPGAHGGARRRAPRAHRRRSPREAVRGGRSGTARAASCSRASAIDALLDPDSAFLELNALAAWDCYDGEAPGAGHRHRDRRRSRAASA